ncbi:MAG TPA: CvpA family protein, partial [Actinomycetota bacterium]|nr:CvpA family protein [Actinomycetota bacterium]
MTLLDVVLLVLLGLSAWAGYRRGAVLQVAGLLGLVVGFAIGAWLAPSVAGTVDSDFAKAAVSLGVIVLFGAVGDAVGSFFGLKVRRRTHGTRFRPVDAVGGS